MFNYVYNFVPSFTRICKLLAPFSLAFYLCLTLFTPVCLCLHKCIYVYPRLLVFYLCLKPLPMFSCDYLCLLVFTCLVVCVYLCLPMFNHVNTTLPMFTSVYSCLPMLTGFYLFTHVNLGSTVY